MPAVRRSVGEQAGFALPELLVAAIIGLSVAAAAMTGLISAVQGQPRLTERSGQIQQGQVMLERLSRETRQGNQIEQATATGMRIHTFVDGSDCGGTAGVTTSCWVEYECSATSCTRTPDGGSPVTVVRGIANDQVFCYAPWDGQGTCPTPSDANPSYAGLRLEFAGRSGQETITLADGTGLRNFSS